MSPKRRTVDLRGRVKTTTASCADPGSAQRTELDQLRQQTEADARVLSALLNVNGSPAVAAVLDEVRGRYERSLQSTCELLGELLQSAENKAAGLAEKNQALQQANAQLQYKLDRANLHLRRAFRIKPKTKPEEPAPAPAQQQHTDKDRKPKSTGKRGAPKGHRGRSRSIPTSVDREETIGPVQFCDCGCGTILATTEFDVRFVEDIPQVAREVTRQMFIRGRCQSCGKVIRNPEATNGPPVVTGPNLAAHLTMMNQMGVTFRKLATFSTRTLGIELSAAGALGIIKRVGASLEGVYGDILSSLPEQPWLNGDETGWKIMGRNGYIWCFCNNDIAFFHHDYRRSAKVIEQILGDSFAGVVICDFYAAYNCIDNTQRCLVHLLRAIKDEREILRGSKLLEGFENAVRKFIETGLQVQAMPDSPGKNKAIAKLEKQLDRLTHMNVTKGKATTLVKRIQKYRDDLIRFVTHPGVEFHNNRAERQLRPMVVNRKVSFGSNTDSGARRYCIIHTVVETCKLQGIDPIDFIRQAYTSGGLDVPSLTGADPPAAAA